MLKRKKQKLISLKEAAKFSGYSADHIGYLIRQGKIPGEKVYSKVTWMTTEEAIKEYQNKKSNEKEQKKELICDITKSKEKKTGFFSRRLKLIAFLIIFLIIGIVPIKFIYKSISAVPKETKVVNFYSQDCSGDWQNPEKVQGKPEVGPDENLDSFSKINSAVYPYRQGFGVGASTSGSSHIICQNFIREEGLIIEESIIPVEKETVLYETIIEQETAAEDIEEKNGTTTEKGTTTTTTTIETIIEEEIINNASNTSNATSGSSTEENLPISFLERLKRSFKEQKVSAQEKDEKFKSIKIKFSFAIGNKEDYILPIDQATNTQIQPTSSMPQNEENNEATSSEDASAEEPISFWRSIRNFISNRAGKIKNVFKFGTLVAKAEENKETTTIETVMPEPDLIEDIITAPTTTDVPATDTNGIINGQNQDNSSSAAPEITLDLDERIIIWYSLDGEMWWRLGSISGYPLSNGLNGGYFEYDISFLKTWEDIENLKIKFEGVNGEETEITSFLDSVWIEVVYDEIKNSEERDFEIVLLSSQKVFKGNEEPEFKFKYEKKKNNNLGVLASLTGSVDENNNLDWKNIKITAEIINSLGLSSQISPELILENNGEFFVRLNEFSRELRPGKYRLKIKIEDSSSNPSQFIETEQEFIWGVLAINTNKSIFLPGESVYLQMAALDSSGNTLCNANLSLEIISPGGLVQNLKVEKSGECFGNNVTDVPDYYAYYQILGSGIYSLKLTNLDNGYQISDSFEVRDSVPFDIERFGPTRIYPFVPYQMIMRIKANQDFSGEIVEIVPSGFDIISGAPGFRLQVFEKEQKLFWQVNLEAGETQELNYEFDAPNISPYLYLLGPLEMFHVSGFKFQEARSWQIAADADTVVFIINTASTTWTIPDDWSASNTIEVIGAGGGGSAVTESAGPGGGGGASGAYAKISNLSIATGTVVTINVGSGGSGGAPGVNGGTGGDTWFNGASCDTASTCAKGGGGATGQTGGVAPVSGSSTGDTIYVGLNGGLGSNRGSPNAGGGGGGGAGASGPYSQGNIGSDGTTNDGGNGGNGGSSGGGTGGTGGASGNPGATGGTGGNGTEWQASPERGSGGGGGGGGAGNVRNAPGGDGGPGGSYGAGGGGGGGQGGNSPGAGSGAAGSQGIIVITYTPYVGQEAPTVTNIKLNANNNINLIESSATTVTATATVSDNNGYNDITSIIGRLYRSGVTSTYDCTTDANNCTPTTTCATSSCSSNDCVATCNFDLWFVAEPTDAGSDWDAEHWVAWMEAKDSANATGTATNSSQTIDVNTLLALEITDLIDYGSLTPGQSNDPLSKLIKATTTGNAAIDANISGIDMCTDYPTCTAATTSITYQHYATSSLNYASTSDGVVVASTSAQLLEFLSTKPTATPSNQAQDIYWGTYVPLGTLMGIYSGVNTISAVAD